jgi:ATP-dependent helicase/nuclease subunit A
MLEKNTKITSTAINTLNKNILVSASAGAGKTKLLIDRLIKRIMIDKVEITRILALTFTDAAASEMKHRLRSELSKNIEENDDGFLRKQLSLVETSSISTIHSFCLSIIKDYSYVLHLDPELVNNLLDEATKKNIFDHCLDEVIQEAIHENNDYFMQLVSVFCDRAENFDPLKKAILSVYYVRSSKVDPLAWDDHVLSYYQKVNKFRSLPDDFKQLIKEHFLMNLKQLLMPVIMILTDYFDILDDAQKEAWTAIRAFILESEDLIKEESLDKANHMIYRLSEIKTKTIKDNDHFNGLREQFNTTLKKQVEKYFAEHIMLDDLSKQEPLVKQLLLLSHRLSESYSNAKKKQKVMDYDDMEKFALEILSNKAFKIYEIYQSQFDDVLVDEFQDTNDIQHEIIQKVSRKNNVFRVGDIKQSIYRFRNAKPQLMRDLVSSKSTNNLVLFLPNNFRSSEEIVEFNNFVFSRLMNIQTFDDCYLDNDHVSIGKLTQQSKNEPVELHMIDFTLPVEPKKEEDDDNNDDVIEYEETTTESLLKARHIAHKMLQFRSEGYHFRDMCVLVKTHKIKASLKQVFDETNIPYFIDTKSGFYHSQAIQDVLAYFRVLINHNDEISLTGLSTSAFYQLSFDDLSKIAIYKKKHKLSTWDAYQVLHPNITSTITQIKSNLKTTRISDIMLMLYQLNDFYQVHCDEKAKINLDFLYEKALGFEKQGIYGLTQFLDTIKNVQDEISSEAIPIGSDEDVVKVMTIHQSKGLQFPIVFFWTNNSNIILDSKEKIIVDPFFGIGMHTLVMPFRYRRSNLLRTAIEFYNIKQELQEQIRLLYVGLTRAEKKMILVGLKQKEPYPFEVDQNMIYKKIGNGGWLYHLFSNYRFPFMKMTVVSPVTSLDKVPKVDTPTIKLPSSRFIVEEYEETKALNSPILDFSTSLKPREQGSLIHLALRKIIESQWTIKQHDLMDLPLNEQHIEQLSHFINHPLTSSLRSMNAYSELPIIMYYQMKYQKGYIDLLLQSDDTNIIIDFKTDVVDDVETLKTRHQQQLLGYHFAISQQFPQHLTKTFIYSLHLGVYVEILT